MIVVLAIAAARDARRAGADAVFGKSIAAIVERRRSAPKASARALAAQAAALDDLQARGVSILPVRFGTVARGERELTRLLAPLAPALAKRLAATRGRRQMTVRVRGANVAAPRTSGRAYLDARVEQERVPQADPVRRAVSRFVIEEVAGPVRGPYAGAVHHLVARKDVDAYQRAVEALDRRMPKRFVVSGPMPPYAFAALSGMGSGD